MTLPKIHELAFRGEDGQEWEYAPISLGTSNDPDLCFLAFRKKQQPAITEEQVKDIFGDGYSIAEYQAKLANLIIETVEKRGKK